MTAKPHNLSEICRRQGRLLSPDRDRGIVRGKCTTLVIKCDQPSAKNTHAAERRVPTARRHQEDKFCTVPPHLANDTKSPPGDTNGWTAPSVSLRD